MIPVALATIAFMILVTAISIWVTPQTSGSVYAAMIGGVNIPAILALVGAIIVLIWMVSLQKQLIQTQKFLAEAERKKGPGLQKYSDEAKEKVLNVYRNDL